MNQAEPNNTKAKIIDAALELFSVNGYETVSIRDIGKAVGIKESSIYYHFKNKEEILQTILNEAEQGMQVRKTGFNVALAGVEKVACQGFIMAGAAYVEGFLLEPRIYKLIKLLTMEKQRNGEAADLYHKLLFTEPLEHHGKVFSVLIDRGFIKEDSKEELAGEYQAIILYVFEKYFSGPTVRIPDAVPLARQELSALLQRFYNRYFL